MSKQSEAKTTANAVTTIVLDLETFGGEKPALEDVKIASNITKPETILKNQIDGQDKQWRKQALDPFKGIIFCIGLQVNEDDPFIIMGSCEQELMEAFDTELSMHDNIKVVAHFGDTFDFFYLFIKGLKYGMRHVINLFSGQERGKLIDTAKVIQGTFRRADNKISLDKMTLALTGKSAKDGVNGSMVHDMVLEDKIEEICEYCIDDVRALVKSYKVMKYWGLV